MANDFSVRLDGGVGVVGDGGDVAAVEVAQDHRLEQVVDVLTGNERSTRALPSTRAFALEVADAAGEQHHLADGQLRHLHALGASLSARPCPAAPWWTNERIGPRTR